MPVEYTCITGIIILAHFRPKINRIMAKMTEMLKIPIIPKKPILDPPRFL